MIACESCRSQARTLLRAAVRPTALRPASRTTKFLPTVGGAATSKTTPVRYFSDTSARKILGVGGLGESYRVLGASEKLYKACGKAAGYTISKESRDKDQVERLDDGEEVGRSVDKDNVWHKTFNLRPTFSTWSHVTMLHLYLLNARIRCFDAESYRNWQQQLIDHFFFECEKKMHVDHSITSSALRQRYLKDIFVQWRGLLLAYDEGLIKGDAVLASAVWRNLFKGAPETDPRSLLAIVGWMRSSLASLEDTSDFTFPNRAPEVLGKPVESFWTMVEEPLRKGPEQAQAQGRADASKPARPSAASK